MGCTEPAFAGRASVGVSNSPQGCKGKKRLRVRARPPGWSKQELAHFRRAMKVLSDAGLALETASGASDEGEPWVVFCDADSGEVVAHFAKISGKYVVSAPFLKGSLSGRVFPRLVGRFLDRCLQGLLLIQT